MTLDPAFLTKPLAHRGLHDGTGACPENSLPAIEAAIAAGYGIEIDVQETADAAAMVFHDDGLLRLAGQAGRVREKSAFEMTQHRLLGGAARVPTLPELLSLVAGRVPLLIENKDQDGSLGDRLGALEEAVARDLSGYAGPVAVMSFNPHSVAKLARLAPKIPRGLVTCSFKAPDWPGANGARLTALRSIRDYERVGAAFISHEAADLDHPRVAELKSAGAAILTWTIRSPEAEASARRIAQNITFEGYRPAAMA